jgi:hypothetical protein
VLGLITITSTFNTFFCYTYNRCISNNLLVTGVCVWTWISNETDSYSCQLHTMSAVLYCNCTLIHLYIDLKCLISFRKCYSLPSILCYESNTAHVDKKDVTNKKYQIPLLSN